MISICLFLLLALGTPLIGQEKRVVWPDIRKNAEHHFAEATRESSIRFIQSLPVSPVSNWQKGPEYWEFLEYFTLNLNALREQFSMDSAMASAVAFSSYSFSDGFLDHQLDTMLGDLIKNEPKQFLKGFISHPQGTRLSLEYGYLLCDGSKMKAMAPDDVLRELEDRVRALNAVKDEDLGAVRDECIKAIRRELDKRIRFSQANNAKALSSDIIGEYLQSPYLEARRRAYDRILSRRDEYLPLLQAELSRWRDHLRSEDTINRLLYLVSIFKHRSFQPTLEEMLEEPEFEWHCLYDCPLIFAWKICLSFGGWALPPSSRHGLTGSVYSEIARNPVPITKQDPRDHIKGPGVDGLLNRMVKLDEKELIRLAGPANPDREERTAAAYTLEYTVDNGRNLDDLYWLAVTEIVDASAQYRSAIYQAIVRAELAKQADK